MDVTPQNVHWLIPEEPVPCDIFLHFRGQYPLVLHSGQNVTFVVLEKLAKTKCTHVFHRTEDLAIWKAWTSRRHFVETAKESDGDADAKLLYGNKRAELISFAKKTFNKKSEGVPEMDAAMKSGFASFMKLVKSPMLDWYFNQFHEPPHLFHHTARVALSTAIFAHMTSLITEKEVETLIFACLIHELEGDPAASLNTVVSQQTLSVLEKHKRPVPEEVINLIQLQDELCSGKGFPNNKKLNEIPVAGRIFTLFNHLDHYKLKDGISRRARFDQAKQLMAARKADYDPTLWALFWEFWEKHLETV